MFLYQLQHGMISLNYLMDRVLYQICKIILSIKKKKKIVTDNLPIRIYVNKIGNRIAYKTKTGHYLELLMSEMMKLLGSTKNKISMDENGENVPHLEIT